MSLNFGFKKKDKSFGSNVEFFRQTNFINNINARKCRCMATVGFMTCFANKPGSINIYFKEDNLRRNKIMP